MHVGLGLVFQGLDNAQSDRDVYRFELGLAAGARYPGGATGPLVGPKALKATLP